MIKVKYLVDSNEKKEKELYYIISGRIKQNYINLLNKYDISQPNSESSLKYCI